MKQSAKNRMLKALQRGSEFSNRQAQCRFGVQNVYARIEELRREGYPIETVTAKSGIKKYMMPAEYR